MTRIRCNLNEGVDGIVENAKVMSDWRFYVRSYPWACVGAAVALGYLIVPARLEIMRPDPETLAELAKQNRLLVKPEAEPQKRGGLTGAFLSLLAGAAMRGVTSYATGVASQAMAQQAARYRRPTGAPKGPRI
jgi:hypothetical protein